MRFYDRKRENVIGILYMCLWLCGEVMCNVKTSAVSGAHESRITCDIACSTQTLLNKTDIKPWVKTNYGLIAGKYVNIFGRNEIAAFLRIPYGKPPLHERRFKKADPVEAWSGILECNAEAQPCMQYSAHKTSNVNSKYAPTEDCLFLNIYVPQKNCCVRYEKMPVLLWIHGGSFSVGNSAYFDGSIMALHGKVIVVTINYRLGVFGFVNGGTEEAPGNVGLLDQTLAIKWVSENIEHFGGDPNRITLFGQSAGGISVGLHMVSPVSRNMFHRGMMSSGSVGSPFTVDNREATKTKANAIANVVKCANNDSNMDTNPNEVIQCLKQTNAMDLAKAEETLRPITHVYFGPSLDNDFLPKYPLEYYDAGEFVPGNVLLGNLKDETSFLLTMASRKAFPLNQEPNVNLTFVKTQIPIIWETMPHPIREEAFQFYFKGIAENDSPALVEALKNGIGDFTFDCPTLFLAEKLNRPYVYWNTYLSDKDRNSKWVGPYHGYDVPYIFGFPFLKQANYTDQDRRWSRYILDEWIHFALTGYPLEVENTSERERWPKFSPSTAASYKLATEGRRSISFPRKEACEFWRRIFANFPT